jgi:hypothetical protein
LLILLAVFAGMPGSVRLFEITCLVVLMSVFLHGAAIAVFLRKDAGPGGPVTTEPFPPSRAELATSDVAVPERISIEEMRKRQEAREPLVLADVRTDRTYESEDIRARGAVRLPPDDAVRRARELGLDHHGTVVLYCA